MINLKKPEFVQRLTIKRIVLTLGGVAVVVAGLGVAGFMIFSGGDDNQTPDQKFSLNKNNKVDVNLNKEISTLVINQNNESDGNSNLNNMQNIISGQSQQYSSNNLTDSITSNQSGIGTFQKPLGSVVDTSYLNNQPIDLSKLSDQDLEDYYRKQNGLKIVKVASYNAYVAPDGTTPYVDNNQQTNSQNQNLNTPTQNNQNGTTNPILGYDRKGNAIYGYTKDGQPIYGFDKKGQPILTPLNKVIGYTKDGQPIYGYDANGNAILSKDGKSNSLLNSQNQNQNNLNTDKNGNIIYGYTREGKPIYGYDENGKPILTPLSKVVGYTKDGQPIYGYDANGNAILSKNGRSNIVNSIDNSLSTDKNGNTILGYTKDGLPIYGYDANGQPILTPLNKVVGYTKDGQPIYGYDANGNAILSKDGKSNSLLNSQNQNQNNLNTDKNGNIIYGYTREGKPIYGYDENGKPILTPLNKVVGYTKDGQPIYGYDANGNAILSKNGKSNIVNSIDNSLSTDKNGNTILGYTKDGLPIYGYDANGQPILTPLNKVIGYTKDGQPIYGYDANGNPILSKKGVSIDNIASVGRLGNSSVPALNENFSNSNGNNVNTPIVSNSNGKSNVLNNLGKGSPSGSINSETSNNTGTPPVQAQQSQEVDKTSPLVSLSFKDIKPNNGFVSYNEDGTTQESKPLNSNVSESSTNTNDNKQQLSQKRQMLTNKFTIRAGDYIPAILQTGINSDLPGSISARVSENVYDTATGRYLLIPQGSKLLGAYSANIQYGQERILAAWNELIYPDGSIVMLNNQPGTDLAGFAGFNDQVNNHYWSLFGNTFILSVLTTGLGYSQNNNSNSQNGSGFNQQLSANTGQMMGQAASTILQKSINIAPTLTIRNGYRMNILLTQDVVLDSPYKLIYYK